MIPVRTEFETSDTELTSELMSAFYRDEVRIAPPESGPARVRMAMVATPELSTVQLLMNGEFLGGGSSDDVLVARMRTGRYVFDGGGPGAAFGAGEAFHIAAGQQVQATLVEPDLSLVTFRREQLDDVARQVAPGRRARMDFSQHAPVTAERGRLVATALDMVDTLIGDDDAALASELVRASAAHMIISAAVFAFARFDPEAERPAAETAVHRAARWMDDRLAEPITVGDAAAAVGLSVRGLHAGFIRVFGITPYRYLRRARLSQVRAALMTSDPEAESVAAVAHSWGFSHLGRFAAYYRGEFGELPSSTLRG